MAEPSRAARVLTLSLALVVGSLVLSSVYATWRPSSSGRARGPGGLAIRVQVWNGSREAGAGARVARALRDGGFQVVEVVNADRSDYVASMVVARGEDPSAARAVARYLGRPPIIRQAWASDQAEVTVVIGSDRSRLRIQ